MRGGKQGELVKKGEYRSQRDFGENKQVVTKGEGGEKQKYGVNRYWLLYINR